MGKTRYLAPTGRVAFHSVSVDGVRSESGNDFIKDRFYKGLEIFPGYKALSKEATRARQT
jgi:hypothetical protein